MKTRHCSLLNPNTKAHMNFTDRDLVLFVRTRVMWLLGRLCKGSTASQASLLPPDSGGGDGRADAAVGAKNPTV